MASIRIYLNILLAIVVLGITAACSDHDNMLGGDDSVNVRLTLQPTQQTVQGTRAPDQGVDELNENKIDKVELFFYSTEGAEKGEQPIHTFTQTFTTKESAEIEFEMSRDKFKGLFPYDATTCKVYAIVNRPDNVVLPDDKSLASLKGSTKLSAPGFTTVSTQSNFVMDGEAPLTRNDNNLSGEIPVERVAAKISLVISQIKTVSADGQEWTPDRNNVRLSLYNASTCTYLGSTYIDNENNKPAYIYTPNADELFSIETVLKYDEQTGQLTIKAPIYTYPTYWREDEKLRTYFVLEIDWKRTVNGKVETKTTYYEINVNAGGSYIQRNRHYKIIQEVGVLGSETINDATLLYPCTYLILDWGSTKDYTSTNNNTNSNASLGSFKYLVVDEVVTEMSNVFSKQIYFFSSDHIDLNTAKIEWVYTGETIARTLKLAEKKGDTGNYTMIDATDTGGDITYIFTTSDIDGVSNRLQGDYVVKVIIHNSDAANAQDRSYIYIEHKLNNNMDASADYTDYLITLNVAHRDNRKYNQTINITQYPMIAIKAEQNSKPNTNGGVWVNGGSSFGGVHGLGGSNSSNDNPNRYIISVSALNSGSEYIIGDPREKDINIPLNNSSNAPTMKYPGDTNNRSLAYYHRTDESQSTKNMISPQFMIASSYGKTESQNKANARNRCATYQEDGYPAGRWRIPTEAEIQYIVQLSAWGVIPCLFGYENQNQTATYWSANGAVAVNDYAGTAKPVDNVNVSSSYSVRCVYDTWYWTDKCDKTKFTWGDKAEF